jgi:hypothetical protein
MSLPHFLSNLRTARNVVYQAVTGLAFNDPNKIRRLLRAYPFWFTPAVLEGYDPEELSFLTAEQRELLDRNVQEFKAVVADAGGEKPPDEQVRTAFQLLADIAHPFERLLADPTGDAVLLSLWSDAHNFPDYCIGFDYRVGSDSTGDPAIWVWVIVADETDVVSDEFIGFLDTVRRMVWDGLAKVKSDRWPFVRVRTVSEERELLAEGVA